MTDKAGIHDLIYFQKTKQYCQNQHSCSVDATNAIFGDPCKGKIKTLVIKYICRRSSK